MDPAIIASLNEGILGNIGSRRAWKNADMDLSAPVCFGIIPEASTEALRILEQELTALECLGEYYEKKCLAAWALGAYYNTGRKRSLQVASETVMEASANWQRLVEVTSNLYRPLIVPSRMRTMEFTWERGMREITRDIERVREVQQELDLISGLRIRVSPVDTVEAGASSGPGFAILGDYDEAWIEYRKDGEVSRIETSREASVGWVPVGDVSEGILEYRIVARRGKRVATWPDEGFQRLTVVERKSDTKPPSVENAEFVHGRLLEFRAVDDSGIASATLFWYPLNEGEPLRWMSTELTVDSDGRGQAQLPEYPCLWRIEVVDHAGRLFNYPPGYPGTPYAMIPF
jgi:hypothetical protein